MFPTSHMVAGMINVTVDTNCIIALEENRPEARALRRIVRSAAERTLSLRVVAISASERQPDGSISESFCDFEAKIAKVGLQDAEILLPPAIWSVTYWDHCIWATDEDWKLAEEIHRILFPSYPFEYEDYCRRFDLDPTAPGAARKWRNRVIDTLTLWTHIYNDGGVFVTSDDDDFHGSKTKAALARLGSGEILRPGEAAMKCCLTYPAVAPPEPGD